ncbi:MAG: hypothetical protein ABSC08_14740 [Bryobacteraceae bacterium]|jgi:hypothetical protein
MFTWICPQCGREVPPSYSECPTCAENRQRAAQGLPPIGVTAAAPPPQAPPAPQPAYQPPAPPYPVQAPTQFFQQSPAAPPPQQPPYPPAQGYAQPQQPYAAAPQPMQAPPPAWPAAPQPPQPEQPVYTLPETAPSHGMPAWLVVILVAVLAIGGLFLAYKLLGGKSEVATSPVKTETASTAPKGADANPYAKYIEVAGIRIIEDEKQQIKATFVVVNHSAADMPSLALQVTLRTTSAKPGDEPVAVVNLMTGPLPANTSKDISVPLKTTLRAYELPDWQFLRVSVDFPAQR